MSKFLEVLGEGSKMVVLRKNDEKEEKKELKARNVLLKELNILNCQNIIEHVILFYIYFYKFKYIHFFSYNFVKNSVIKIEKKNEQKFDVTLQHSWVKQLRYDKDYIFDDSCFAYNSFLILEPYFAEILEKTVNAYYEKKKKKNQNTSIEVANRTDTNELCKHKKVENKIYLYYFFFFIKLRKYIKAYFFKFIKAYLLKLKHFISFLNLPIRKPCTSRKQIIESEHYHEKKRENEEKKKNKYMFKHIYNADNITFYNGLGKNKYEYGYLEENLFFIPPCIPTKKICIYDSIEKDNMSNSIVKNYMNEQIMGNVETRWKEKEKNIKCINQRQRQKQKQKQKQSQLSENEQIEKSDCYVSVELKFKCGIRDFQNMPDRYNIQQFIKKKKKKKYWGMCLYSPSDFFTLHFWNIFKNLNYIFLYESNNINVYINDQKQKRPSKYVRNNYANTFFFSNHNVTYFSNSKKFYAQYLNEQMGNIEKRRIHSLFASNGLYTFKKMRSCKQIAQLAAKDINIVHQHKISNSLETHLQPNIYGHIYKPNDLHSIRNNKMNFNLLEKKMLLYNYYARYYFFCIHLLPLNALNRMEKKKNLITKNINQLESTNKYLSVSELHTNVSWSQYMQHLSLSHGTNEIKANEEKRMNLTNSNIMKRIKQKIRRKKKVYKLIKKNMYTINPKWNCYEQEEDDENEEREKGEREKEEKGNIKKENVEKENEEKSRYNSLICSYRSSFFFLGMLGLLSTNNRQNANTDKRNNYVKTFSKKKGKGQKSCRNFYNVYKKIKKKFKKKKKKKKKGLYLKKNAFKRMKHKVKKTFLYKINKRIYYLCDRRFNKKFDKIENLKETFLQKCKTVKQVYYFLHKLLTKNLLQKAGEYFVKCFLFLNTIFKRHVFIRSKRTINLSFCEKETMVFKQIKEKGIVENVGEIKNIIKNNVVLFENFYKKNNKEPHENMILLLSLIVKKEKMLFYKMLYFQCFNAGQIQLVYCMMEIINIFENIWNLKSSEEMFNDINYYKKSVKEIFQLHKNKNWKKNKHLLDIVDLNKIKKISKRVFNQKLNNTYREKRKNIKYEAFIYLQNCHFIMGNEIVIEAIHLLNKVCERKMDLIELELKRKTRKLYKNLPKNDHCKNKYSFNYNKKKMNKKKLYYSVLSKAPISSFQHFFNLTNEQFFKYLSCNIFNKSKNDIINCEAMKICINKQIVSIYIKMILFVCRFLISKTFCDHSTIFNIYKTDSAQLKEQTLLCLKERRFKVLRVNSQENKHFAGREKKEQSIYKYKHMKKNMDNNCCNDDNNECSNYEWKETELSGAMLNNHEPFLKKKKNYHIKTIKKKKASYFNTRNLLSLHLKKKKMLIMNTFNKNIKKNLMNEYVFENNKIIFYRISLIDISIKSVKRMEFWKTQTEEIINTYNTVFR